MAWRLFVAKPLSEPTLVYCQLDHENIFLWNLIWNSKKFIQENARENIVCEMVAILCRPQCVDKVVDKLEFKFKFKCFIFPSQINDIIYNFYVVRFWRE